jgi:exopolysaccharide biosynthesis polyprenyl glycosylphosphotransferase
MLRRFSIDFALFSIILDAILIFLALVIATLARPYLSTIPYIAHIPLSFQIPLTLYLLFPLLWVLILLFTSVYDGRRNLRFWKELTSLSIGSFIAAIVLAGTLYLTYRGVSRVLFLTFATLAYLLLLSWRLLVRVGYNLGYIKSVQDRNVLIIGAGDLGRELEKQVVAYQVLGLNLIGFLDDDLTKQETHSDIVGGIHDALSIVTNQEVDDVVFALPPRAYEQTFQLIAEIQTLPVKIWVIPDFFKLSLHKIEFSEFAGLPMLDLRAPALSDYQRLVKRVFDLLLTILFLPINLALMGFISIAIKLEGPGEIIFRQKRVGENGRIFEMLKFRTMIPGAEELRGEVETINSHGDLVHKSLDDPRVTYIGRILRRTSLDELPQTFNVLKGEMSLVGPRPELPYLVDKYKAWQYKRFAVPQGLTGWWQVNGRSNKPMHLHTEDDLYYIENYSVFLDLLILVKTIGVVLKGEGAF